MSLWAVVDISGNALPLPVRGCLTKQVRQPKFYAKKEGDFGKEVSKMVYNVVDKKTKSP